MLLYRRRASGFDRDSPTLANYPHVNGAALGREVAGKGRFEACARACESEGWEASQQSLTKGNLNDVCVCVCSREVPFLSMLDLARHRPNDIQLAHSIALLAFAFI